MLAVFSLRYWRWVSWINPLAYVLEGVAVNEFRGDQTVLMNGQSVPGLVALQQTANLPRYRFGEYGALDTPQKVWESLIPGAFSPATGLLWS